MLPGQQFAVAWKDEVFAIIGTILVSVGAVVAGLLILAAGAVGLYVYLRQQSPPPSGHQEGLGERVAELEVLVRGLPSLWEEERQRAKKQADSAKQANREAARKLEEVEELIEAGLEIPGGNEAGSNPLEMQPMPTRLGDPPASDRRERVEAVAHLLR